MPERYYKDGEEELLHLLKEPEAEYTVNDYLSWRFEEMVELIRGKIFRMSPAPTPYHQVVTGNLYIELGNYFRTHPCHVFIAPFDVFLPIYNNKTRQANTVVQPDLFVVCDVSKIDDHGCQGVPDLIIETISKHTSKKDIELKHAIYEETGVKEYWVVYPNDHIIQVYFLDHQGKYQRKGAYTEEEVISPVLFPDLKVDLSMVFAELQ